MAKWNDLIRDVFLCPSTDHDSKIVYAFTYSRMEGLYWTLPIYRKTKYTNSAYPSLFGTPTNTVLAADGYNPQNGGDSTCLQVTSTGGFALPQFRHGNLGNFVFIDGHVTSMNPDELAPAGGQSQKYFVFAPQTFWRPFNHKYYDRNGALINL